MNAWLVASAVLLTLGLPPCLWQVYRRTPQERLAGLNLAATMCSAILLLFTEGFNRSSYVDLPLVLAVLAPAGTLVFARFLGGQAAQGEPD
ncbi:monovalent cation/H+ antiporter complex subunit F [Streptantibioticus rubrisoli]|uniref:Monovalent cation/H+ antiporter complex subunit F n=1 Tax=Streptantibioticus rubrisoli TaxID=1387313 RepID=A0ABT1PE08_9ACTN|nr:monovalent cation/H+ antiporter complex subunit F [Streptantibioticus rubrisoli]MCQ4042693.1 monovalent cation/H+ antiporter complex subunit F [Streptantibioticus rubrisoli]